MALKSSSENIHRDPKNFSVSCFHLLQKVQVSAPSTAWTFKVNSFHRTASPVKANQIKTIILKEEQEYRKQGPQRHIQDLILFEYHQKAILDKQHNDIMLRLREKWP